MNHKVYGPFGEERDCVSKIEGKLRFFECDFSRIPEARLENQPLLYVILIHEAFIHAEIEKPTSETLPSSYPVSSRIGNTKNLSLVTYQKWVPRIQAQDENSDFSAEIYWKSFPYKKSVYLTKAWPYSSQDLELLKAQSIQTVKEGAENERNAYQARWEALARARNLTPTDLSIRLNESISSECFERATEVQCNAESTGTIKFQSIHTRLLVLEKTHFFYAFSFREAHSKCDAYLKEVLTRPEVLVAYRSGGGWSDERVLKNKSCTITVIEIQVR